MTAMNRPSGVMGVMSPYPSVVTVVIAHHHGGRRGFAFRMRLRSREVSSSIVETWLREVTNDKQSIALTDEVWAQIVVLGP
jgi:hypothetical protein